MENLKLCDSRAGKRSALVLLLSLHLLLAVGQSTEKIQPRNVAIFLYPEAELLDFAGPQEVLTKTFVNDELVFNVYTVAVDTTPLVIQGLIIKPQFKFTSCPRPDIIIIPGGNSADIQNNQQVVQWVKERAANVEITMSVCSGVSLLLKAGLLDGKDATTHHLAMDIYAGRYPTTRFHKNTRFVDNGNVITTAGVSAGIDGALHLVEKLFGHDVAMRTVSIMEYDRWQPAQGLIIDGNKE